MADPRRDEVDSSAETLDPSLSETFPIAHAPTLPAALSDEVLVALRTTISGVEATLDAETEGVPRPSTLTAEHPGRYRLREELGQGGVGRVVLAIDDHLGREVALKELHGGAGEVSDAALARFVREARVTGQLEHPGIVPVHELAQRPDGTLYYTMKRIRGRSLAAALSDAKTLDDRLALLRHFEDVCEAMAYAHSRGVVHRDLKPGNVMVGEFGETLVVDWGLAKVRGAPDAPAVEQREPLRITDAAQTVGGYAIGTPSYMSPEQARGDLAAIDERSDVWGLGAMLFELLTGRPPYVGTSVLALLHAVLADTPPKVRAITPDAPPELAAIADRALARDPSQRYPGAKELADEVRAFQEGRRVRAYEYGALELARRFVRANRAASIAAAVIALTTLFAIAMVSWSYRDERIARRAAETRSLIAEAGRLDQVGHRSHAFALLRAAHAIGGEEIAPELARAGFFAHADEPQPIVLAGHPTLVHFGVFSADGARVITISGDTLRTWDPRTGALRGAFADDDVGAMQSLALSRDGRTLIASGAGITVWNVAAEEITLRRRIDTGGFVVSMALAPDARHAASGDREGVGRVWDLATGEGRTVTEHGDWLRALSFSPDGRRLLTCARDGTCRITSVRGAEPPLELTVITSEVRAVDWSRSAIAIGLQSGAVEVLTPDGERVRTIAAHAAPVTGVRFSSDGTRLATASEDAHARVWGTESGALVLDLPHRGRVSSIAFDRRGRRLVTTEIDHEVALVWNLPEHAGLALRGHDGWVHDAVFSPDGTTIASASRDGTVRIWDASAGLERRVLRDQAQSVYCVQFSPDGARLATGGRDGHVRLWDPRTGERVGDIAAHRDAVYGLAFLDEDRLASVSVDQRVRVWSVPDGRELYDRALSSTLSSVAARAGWLAVGGNGGLVEVWRPDAPDAIVEIRHGIQGIYGLALSSDGSRIASASLDGTALVFETATGRLVREVARLERGITAIDFSPDDQRVTTASEDGSVRVWEVRTGHLVTSFEGHGQNARAASFSPTGDRVVSAGADATVRVWPSGRVAVAEVTRATGALTNLRVCRESFAVVPIVLGAGVNPVWAPDAACAAAPLFARAAP